MTNEEFAQQVFAVDIGGIQAGQRLQELLAFSSEMHKVHGLDAASTLTLSETLRAAGVITQDISETDAGVTYVRT